MNKKFFAEIITIILAIIGGAVWIGNLQGQLSALNPESIKQEKNNSIEEIKAILSSMEEKQSSTESYSKNDIRIVVDELINKKIDAELIKPLTNQLKDINNLSNQNKSLLKQKIEMYEPQIKSLKNNVEDILLSLNIMRKPPDNNEDKIKDIYNSIFSLKNHVHMIEKNIAKYQQIHDETIKKFYLRVNEIENSISSLDLLSVNRQNKVGHFNTDMNQEEKEEKIDNHKIINTADYVVNKVKNRMLIRLKNIEILQNKNGSSG